MVDVLGCCAGHHRSDQDEHAARGPRGDRGEDGREEDGDEEADSRHAGGKPRLRTLGNTSTGLDKRRHRRAAQQRADRDAKGVDHVRDGRALKVTRNVIRQPREARHAVQRARAVEDIHVEEGNKREAKLPAVGRHVPILHEERLLDLVKVDDLAEELKRVVPDIRVREIRNRRVPRPRDDAHQQDPGNNGALDAVHHEQHGEEAAAEHADPHLGVAHLVPVGAGAVVEEVLRVAAAEREGGGDGAGDEGDALAVGEADEGEVHADAGAHGDLDGARDGAREPLAHAEDGEAEEDPALDEDGGQGYFVGDGAGAVVADDGVGEVGVESWVGLDGSGSWCLKWPHDGGGTGQENRGYDANLPIPGASPTGLSLIVSSQFHFPFI